MEPIHEVFDAKVTMRCLIYWLPRIKSKLKSHYTRNKLFRETIFGPWLDIPFVENDNHLLNYILQHQIWVEKVGDDFPPITYKIGDKVFSFGRDEFISVTGFRCGTPSYKENSSDSPFCARVFPSKDQRKRKKIKPSDLIDVFDDHQMWSQLSDADAVRVCLLIVVELVFIGRQSSYYTPNHILSLVEDFDDWNAYPWGEYLWRRFYEKTVNVVPVHYNRYYTKKIKAAPKKLATYNLEGFVWALKIWIFETFPSSKIWWKKDPTKTPCCVAWSKQKTFSKLAYSLLFGKGSNLSVLERPVIVGEEHVIQEPDVRCIEGTSQTQGLTTVGPQEVFPNDARFDELALHDVCVKDATNTEVATLKTILGLLGKDGANVAVVNVVRNRLADIDKIPDQFQTVQTNTSKSCETDVPTEKLNYLDPGSYPSAMSQLEKLSDLTPSDPVVDCFPSANDIDIHLPNLNETFCETAVDENHVFDDYMLDNEQMLEKIERKAVECDQVKRLVSDKEEDTIYDHTLSGVFDDDNEEAELGEQMLENLERKAVECDQVQGLVSDKEEDTIHDHTLSGGFDDDNEEAELGEQMLENLERKAVECDQVQGLVSDKEEDTIHDHTLSGRFDDDYECDKVHGFVLDEKENTNAGHTSSNGFDDDYEDEKESDEITQNKDTNSYNVQEPEHDKREKVVNKVGDAVMEDEGNKLDVHKPGISLVICDLQNQMMDIDLEDNKTPKFDNVVKVGDRPCAEEIFKKLKKKKNVVKRKKCTLGMASDNEQDQVFKRMRFPGPTQLTPYMKQPATTPTVNKKRFKRIKEKNIMPIAFAADDGEVDVQEWIEDLSRSPNCNRNKTTIPTAMDMFLKKGKKTFHKFPWGDVVAGREFWCQLLCYGKFCRKGWLKDDHLELWIDLMWVFRPSDADWAIAGPFFYENLTRPKPNTCYGDGRRYPIPLSKVEKLYFPLNVPSTHYLLAELQIREGVVTFSDSLGTPTPEKRPKYLEMRGKLEKALPAYLNSVGVFKEKGLLLDDYKISFQVGENVPVQADPYGDCGIWVCINLYRLTHKLSLVVNDPLQAALAYREHMANYFWKYKISL